MKVKIDLRRYFLAIRKKKLIIIVIATISFFIGFALNYNVKQNKYMAIASVYITSSNVTNNEGKIVNIKYTDIVTSKKVANRASKMLKEYSLNGKSIKQMITCTYSEDSPIYYIQATSNNPELSMDVVDAVQKSFVIEMNGLEGDGKAQVLDSSYEYEKVFDGRIYQITNVVIITLVGILICMLIIIINCFITRKIETINDVNLNGEIEVLGVIPNFEVE